MANTNWFIGIDEGASTPGGSQTALAGYEFVDPVNGDDGTGDGSPDNPFATDNPLTSSANIFASGVLATEDITTRVMMANLKRSIILQGSGGNGFIGFSASATDRIIGFIMIGYGSNIPSYVGGNKERLVTIAYNTFIGGTNNEGFSAGTNPSVSQGSYFNIYIGTTVNFVAFSMDFPSGNEDNFSFINNVYEGSFTFNLNRWDLNTNTGENTVFQNWHFGSNGDLIIPAPSAGNSTLLDNLERIQYCNIQCPITIDGTPYADLAAAKAAYPTAFPNCINEDPLWVGDPTELEFGIEPTSPLIGAGVNGTTIGDLKIGELVDLSSPAENNDITVGSDIVITNPATTGNIKPTVKTLSQIRKSPIVKFNGLPDNTDDVPDNESTAIIPKRKTVNILWRETVGGSDNTAEFLYGAPMYVDDSGNYTGEDDFDPFDISSSGDIINNPDNRTSSNVITVAQIQPNFVLNDQ